LPPSASTSPPPAERHPASPKAQPSRNSLISRFNTNYGTTSSSFWTGAPSHPTVNSLFTTSSTYTRPGTTYLALWQALGRDRMIAAMHDIQSTYGGGNITELQLEQIFRNHLPVPSASCNARLDQFFPQWFDTAFPAGGANTTNKPSITGPGLNGTGFVCATVAPASPNGTNGWYTSAPTVTWSGYGAPAVTKTGCVDGAVATQGTNTLSCSVTTNAAPILTSGAVSETVKLDTVAPVTSATLTPTSVGAWYSPRTVTLNVVEATSGVASTTYRLDGGPSTPYTGPFFVATFGPHTLVFQTTDLASNVEAAKTVSWGSDFPAAAQIAALTNLVQSYRLDKNLTNRLVNSLDEANQRLGKGKDVCDRLDDFLRDTLDEAGKDKPGLTIAQAAQLLSANQIEALLGCIPAGSTRPAAEVDVLTLMQTIDTIGLDKDVANDLGNRARHVAQQIAKQDDPNACHELSDLSKQIADQKKNGKITAGQAATLDDLVSRITREIGC